MMRKHSRKIIQKKKTGPAKKVPSLTSRETNNEWSEECSYFLLELRNKEGGGDTEDRVLHIGPQQSPFSMENDCCM